MALLAKPAAAFLSSIFLVAAWSPHAHSSELSANCACDRPVEANSSSIVSLERITKFSPRARVDLALAIARLWKNPPPGELVNPLRVQHFMAQIATETGGFVAIEENLNYYADRLLKVFPTRVTPQQAQRLARHPELIANHVYGGRLGNNHLVMAGASAGRVSCNLPDAETSKPAASSLTNPWERHRSWSGNPKQDLKPPRLIGWLEISMCKRTWTISRRYESS
jgi:hypothetical protein